jgi:GNAT superfamily N-acetyltransferase
LNDPRLDELAESARNRGLKLVRSRVRTPGKRGFGKVALTDKSGKAVLGMEAKGPSASPEEVEDYLRNLGARDWGASLDVAVMPRKKKPARQAANDVGPGPKRQAPTAPPATKPESKPKPEPKPKIREAKPGDAEALVVLIALLEHDVEVKGVRKRIASLAKQDLAPLVATLDKQVVGLCGIHRMIAIHRPKPVGRINILAVAETARGKGIGRMLVEAAETKLREDGCGIVEVTCNDRLAKAHAFYRHMGYERTSIRFAKTL